jgi:integrase
LPRLFRTRLDRAEAVVCVSADHIARKRPDIRDHITNARLVRASSASAPHHPHRIWSVRHAVVPLARHSIPIADRQCGSLAQSIFCTPSRRVSISLDPNDRAPRRRATKCSALCRARHKRHEAACRWLAKGLDRRAIQLLLGHADLKTTQRYLNVTDEELRKTMAEKLWNRGSAGR